MNLLFMANNGLPRNGLVALYDMGKQIALGNTGQTLVDFSGKGNSAQLGSTAGADTNDPAYSGQGLVFGTDDYCVLTNINNALKGKTSCSFIGIVNTINSVADAGLIGSAAQGYAPNTVIITDYAGSANATSIKFYSDTATTSVLIPSKLSNQYQCLQTRLIGSVEVAAKFGNAEWTKTTVSVIPSINPVPTDQLDIGRHIVVHQGTHLLWAIYNRALSDTEFAQAYSYLKRLMSSRGITI